jgi:CDP-6-deoxy-D-xylo-4-hexulose-3-dehydrase
MVCTNDPEVYQQVRMLRSHGMVREANDPAVKADYVEKFPELNPDFIFAYPAYNVRNTEIGGILGLKQLKRLDDVVKRRTHNLKRFLNKLDGTKYQTDFELDGSSNYAFNLILKKPDHALVERLMRKLREEGVEFRRGSAGGGNQVRQPYLRGIVGEDAYKDFPVTDHIHFFGFYIGNFPDLQDHEIDQICAIINAA